MDKDSDLFSGELAIDDAARNILKQIASWAMIIVTTSVIGYVLTLIGAFTGSDDTLDMPQQEGFTASLMATGESPVYSVVSILIGLAINYFLYRFVVLANRVVRTNNSMEVGASFRNLKIYFAITSVLMIALLLLLIIVVVMASFSR